MRRKHPIVWRLEGKKKIKGSGTLLKKKKDTQGQQAKISVYRVLTTAPKTQLAASKRKKGVLHLEPTALEL